MQASVPFFSAKEFNALPVQQRERIIRDVYDALGPETEAEKAILDQRAASIGQEGSYARLLERGLKTGLEVFERAAKRSADIPGAGVSRLLAERSARVYPTVPEINIARSRTQASADSSPESPTTPVDPMKHLATSRIALRGDQVRALESLVDGRVDRIVGAQADYSERLDAQTRVDSEKKAGHAALARRVGPGGFYDIDRGHGMSVVPSAQQ